MERACQMNANHEPADDAAAAGHEVSVNPEEEQPPTTCDDRKRRSKFNPDQHKLF